MESDLKLKPRSNPLNEDLKDCGVYITDPKVPEKTRDSTRFSYWLSSHDFQGLFKPIHQDVAYRYATLLPLILYLCIHSAGRIDDRSIRPAD